MSATPKSIALDTASSQSGDTARLLKIQSALCDRLFNTTGLEIGSGSKKKVKLANTGICLIDGAIKSVASTTEVTLSGSITHGKFNVYFIYATDTDTLAAVMGTEAATLAAVTLPTIPANAVVVGFVVVNPTGTGTFVGGTTDLDDGTVTPNAVYVDSPSSFNPNMLSL